MGIARGKLRFDIDLSKERRCVVYIKSEKIYPAWGQVEEFIAPFSNVRNEIKPHLPSLTSLMKSRKCFKGGLLFEDLKDSIGNLKKRR